MTKKEVLAEALLICENHGVPAEAVKALTTLLEPKKGGAAFNIDDVAVRTEDGEVTYILDSVFKVWMPVYDADGEANFYEKPDTELGWSRFSRAAEKARKDAEKTFKATKDAIFSDLMAGEVEAAEAQTLMEEAEVARKSFELPEGTTEDRPEA